MHCIVFAYFVLFKYSFFDIQCIVFVAFKALAKLDNIVGEHVNHNAGRMLVDFSCCS